MRTTDIITNEILKMLEENDRAEIKRNEFAQLMGCVPSQINYVITSRFTPEQGYIVESRRGGGGYIRITRRKFNRKDAIMHIINSVSDEIDAVSVRIILENLMENGLISHESAIMINAATKDRALSCIAPTYRNKVRASILKEMLVAIY